MCITSAFELGRKTMEAYEILIIAFREETVSIILDWFCKFRNGVTSINYAECSEWPSTSKMDADVVQIKELVYERHIHVIVCYNLQGKLQRESQFPM
jgi:hypothetical protein